jgi:endonuclease YncB( thermonuclease family)
LGQALIAAFLCLVVSVTDADTLRCADGTRIRIAAINARERDGSCIPNAPCPAMRHERAQPIVARMVMGQTLKCRPVGTSYRRAVADCSLPNGRNLSCAIVATGAAAWWAGYARRYRLRGC